MDAATEVLIKSMRILGAARDIAQNYDYVPHSLDIKEYLEEYLTEYTESELSAAHSKYKGCSVSNIENKMFSIIESLPKL